MSLLSMLGINLPGLTSQSNPFSGLVSGGIPTPPAPMGSVVNPLLAALKDAFSGQAPMGQPPLGEAVGPGSHPSANRRPFVSQDERASAAERTGLQQQPNQTPPEQPTTNPQPQQIPMVGTNLLNGKTYDDGSIPESYYASIRSAESGGNDNAKNPLSSAAGRYQFTSGTWGAVAKAHPELGLTPDGRFDPNQQERAIRAFTADNAKVLQANGIPLSGGSLYASHFLGVGGAAKVYKQPDSAMMRDVVGPGVVGANGFLSNMTVGQFKNWAAKKGGGGGSAGGIDTASAQPAVAGVTGSGNGDYNTALNVGKGQQRKIGGHGAPSGGTGPDAGGGGGAHKNSVSPDFQRYQVRKNIDHLRALSPVATIMALENIGKGLRSEGSKHA